MALWRGQEYLDKPDIFKEHEAANLGRADTAILEGDKAGTPQKAH